MQKDGGRRRATASLEAKGAIFGLAAAAAALSVTFGVSWLIQLWAGRSLPEAPPSVSVPLAAAAADHMLPSQLVRGRTLFFQECASCHGKRAEGGFGPDLRHLEISDAQVTATISDGMKPGMPAFGHKFGGADVKALTGYVRSLNK